MWIKVTKQDIKQGQLCNSAHCPIALALKRCVNDEIHIMGEWVLFRCQNSQDDFVSIPLPENAQRFINRLDGRRQVEPFKFWLPLS